MLTEFFFYFITSAFTLSHLFHPWFLLRCLTEKVELVHRKGNVNLKFLTLRKLESLLVCNHQIVGSGIAVLQRLQIKGTAECTLCAVVGGFIGDNLLNITDLLAIRICKI